MPRHVTVKGWVNWENGKESAKSDLIGCNAAEAMAKIFWGQLGDLQKLVDLETSVRS